MYRFAGHAPVVTKVIERRQTPHVRPHHVTRSGPFRDLCQAIAQGSEKPVDVAAPMIEGARKHLDRLEATAEVGRQILTEACQAVGLEPPDNPEARIQNKDDQLREEIARNAALMNELAAAQAEVAKLTAQLAEAAKAKASKTPKVDPAPAPAPAPAEASAS
jgi:hypothetical protein